MQISIPGIRVPQTFVRLSRTASICLILLICTSCGDYYRPVALPLVPSQPNPAATNIAVVITGNGSDNPGASSTIDVSGDTVDSQATVGLQPVAAALAINGTSVFVANSGEDSVSQFAPNVPTPVTTISLPAGSAPDFVASAESFHVYIANHGSGTGNGSVSVIATSNNVVINTVATGGSPVMIAETPNAQKVYVVNGAGSGASPSILSINTVDFTTNPPILPSGGAWNTPIWAVVRSDSQRAYVLDKGAGTVTAIDTSFDTVVGSTNSVGVGADFMSYDPNLNRIYVTNPATNSFIALNAGLDTLPVIGKSITISSPISVTALVDGSRVYVASAALSGTAPSQTVASSVTVINAGSLTVKNTISLASVPAATGCPSQNWSELSMAASPDNSRVFVGNCDAGNTAIIQTSNDALVVTIPAPPGAFSPPATKPTVQRPVFVLTGV